MRNDETEIQWRDMTPIGGEVPLKVFDCPFCDWHYSPGIIPSAQGEYNENRSLQHHIEYRHSWRSLIVSGQARRAELSRLRGESEVADEQLAQLRGYADEARAEIASLRQQLASVGEDARRLDWLADPVRAVRVISNQERTSWGVVDMENGLKFLSRSMITMRAAIDAALSTTTAAGAGEAK